MSGTPYGPYGGPVPPRGSDPDRETRIRIKAPYGPYGGPVPPRGSDPDRETRIRIKAPYGPGRQTRVSGDRQAR